MSHFCHGADMAVQALSEPRLSRAVLAMESSAIRDLLDVIERPGVISLAGGVPAAETFPLAAVRAVVDQVLDDPGALQYSATEGFGPLRAWFAERASVELDRVVVVHGSQQGLDLVARALLDPGDDVVLADPGYVGAIQAFRLAGGHLVGVPSDRDGLCVDDLRSRLASGLRPSLVYVIANFDNPTGATLSLERRVALADLADRYGFTIVEDDPYGELRWWGPSLPSLAAFTDRVVHLGTVSKILCPGMRVGHVLAPKRIADALVLLKQSADLHTSTLAQRVVHGLLTTPGLLHDQVELVRRHYRHQCGALVDALEHDLADRFRFTAPDGGMFVWGSFTRSVDTAALLPRAIEAGVAFVPGAAFAVEADQSRSLRLCFATAAPADLREGTRRIAALLR
jgi:2-aminoadipate transaminase